MKHEDWLDLVRPDEILLPHEQGRATTFIRLVKECLQMMGCDPEQPKVFEAIIARVAASHIWEMDRELATSTDTIKERVYKVRSYHEGRANARQLSGDRAVLRQARLAAVRDATEIMNMFRKSLEDVGQISRFPKLRVAGED